MDVCQLISPIFNPRDALLLISLTVRLGAAPDMGGSLSPTEQREAKMARSVPAFSVGKMLPNKISKWNVAPLPNLDLSLLLAHRGFLEKVFFLPVNLFSHIVTRGDINGRWINYRGLVTFTSFALFGKGKGKLKVAWVYSPEKALPNAAFGSRL